MANLTLKDYLQRLPACKCLFEKMFIMADKEIGRADKDTGKSERL